MISTLRLRLMLGILGCLAAASAAYADFPDLWTKDSVNPISSDFWGTTVIYHEGIYKAWGEADAGGVDYATSPDGRTWTVHPASPVMLPGPGAYDDKDIAVPSVVIVGEVYHMFYSCESMTLANNRIAHAMSPDGIVWTKDPANPVLDLGPPGSHDSNEIAHPSVIYEEPQFRIWYNAHDDTPGDSPQNIAHATSYDGTTWARVPWPVLEPGVPGEWDGSGLFMMNVIRHEGFYYMFYTGGQGDGLGSITPLQTGYANSADGINWTKRSPSEPVLRVGKEGTWDSMLAGAPVVMDTGSGFRMWYAGGTDFDHFGWGLATAEYPSRPIYGFGPYFPLYEGAVWNYQSVENPANTSTVSVCCPFDMGGEPALLVDFNGEYELVAWKNGPAVTYYGYYESAVFNDFDPDLVFDTFQDGSTIAFPCDTPPCEQFELVRVWTELDHPDLWVYDIDPGWHDLIVIAHYSGGDDELPNNQNEIMESNLPPGVSPPPGAVTDLEWRQRGVGVVATIGVSASTGELHEKYILVDISPVPDAGTSGRKASHLHQNRPNPFNPRTVIAFDLSEPTVVNLRVFDLSGRLVRSLILGEVRTPGHHEVDWNGRDDAGRQVASGTYFYRMEAGDFAETKRMVLMK